MVENSWNEGVRLLNIFVILGAYNEEKGIGELLKNLSKIRQECLQDIRILVVNDGSRDKTSEVVRSFASQIPIQLIEFDRNRGIVEVFRTAFEQVVQQSNGNDYCITMDADNTHRPELILQIVEKLRQGQDIVIASRFAPGGRTVGAPAFRAFLSDGVAFMLSQLVRIPGVKDYSTFYRGYRVSLIREGLKRYGGNLVAGEGFAGMAGLLIRLSYLTSKISEVPLTLRYDLKHSRSTMKIFKTMRGYLRLTLQYLQKELKPSPFLI